MLEKDMRRLAMHQPNFLPWTGYFHKMYRADIFVLMDNAQVSRGRSCASRTKIKSQSGEQWLTLPIPRKGTVAYNEQALMPIDCWLAGMWMTLRQEYGQAPYWDYKDFEGALNGAAEASYTLSEFNERLICWARDALGIDTPMVKLSELGIKGAKEIMPIHLCKKFGCDTYLSGEGAREYNNPATYKIFDVGLEYQEWECQPYQQRWNGFCKNLSILDPIFNLGPQAWLVATGNIHS